MPYIPRCVIWNHRRTVGSGENKALPFHLDALSDQMWNQTRLLDPDNPGSLLPSGLRGKVKQEGLEHTLLDKNKQFIEDPLLGQQVFRYRSIRMTYKEGWQDHPKEDWEVAPKSVLNSEGSIISHGWNMDDSSINHALENARSYMAGQLLAIKSKYATAIKKGQSDPATARIIPQLDPDIPGAVKPIPDPPAPPAKDPAMEVTYEDRLQWNQLLLDQDRLAAGNTNYMFLSTWPGAMETFKDGIFWELGAPNCQICYMSKIPKRQGDNGILLEQDRSILFRLARMSAGPAQANHEMRIFIGNDIGAASTMYALVSSDNGVYWWHFRNMRQSKMLKLLNDRENIMDAGRLTASDKQTIADLKAQVGILAKDNQIRKSAAAGTSGTYAEMDTSEVGRLGLDPNITQNARDQILIHKKTIEGIEESKTGGMTALLQEQLSLIEDELFLAKEQVRLPEDVGPLLDNAIDYNISFSRKGHITIHIGTGASEPWVYENKRVKQQWAYSTMLPPDCRMYIWSNGGAWGFALGAPDYTKKGRLWLQPFEARGPSSSKEDPYNPVVFDLEGRFGDEAVPPYPDSNGWRLDIEAIGIASHESALIESVSPFNLLALPGCRITAKIEQLRPPGGTSSKRDQRGLYQLRIDFESDGRYSPELFYVGVYCLGGEPTKHQYVLWDSLGTTTRGEHFVPGDDSIAGMYDNTAFSLDIPKAGESPKGTGGGALVYPRHQHIMDISMTESDDRAASYEMRVLNMVDQLSGLTMDLEGRMADISLIDMQTGKQQYLVTSGIVHGPRFTERSKLDAAPFHAYGRLNSQVEFEVSTLEDVASRPVPAQIVGNGKLPNVYIYELLRNAGLYEDEIGFDTKNPIPGMVNGLGTTEYESHILPPVSAGKPPDIKPDIQTNTLEFINSLLTSHFPGWKLVFRVLPSQNRMRAHLVEWNRVWERPFFQYSTKHPPYHPFHIRRRMEVYQDVSDYNTSFRVQGEMNDLTGKRFESSISLNEAADTRFQGKSLFFIGYHRPLTLPPNPSLKSNAACARVLRAYFDVKALPPYYIDIIVPLMVGVSPSTVIWVDGIRVVVEGIKFSSLTTPLGQLMTLTCRIHDDRPLKDVPA